MSPFSDAANAFTKETIHDMLVRALFIPKTLYGGQEIADFISKNCRQDLTLLVKFAINEIITNALMYHKKHSEQAITLLFREHMKDTINAETKSVVVVDEERLANGGIKISVKDENGSFFNVKKWLGVNNIEADNNENLNLNNSIHGRGLKIVYRLCTESLDKILRIENPATEEQTKPIFADLQSIPNKDANGKDIGTIVEVTILSHALNLHDNNKIIIQSTPTNKTPKSR